MDIAPILAGGFGHHESSRIWIYDTNIDKVIFEDSLHGESIKLKIFLLWMKIIY